MKNFHAAVAQYALCKDVDHNLQCALDAIRMAADQGADLVLLPELGYRHYFCIEKNREYFNYAETIPGPTTEILAGYARQYSIIVVTTIFEKASANTFYNTAVVLEKNGDLAGTWRKRHLPNDPGYYEQFYFSAGNRGYLPVQTSIGTLGVMVCYDQWFPEAARAMTLAGAQLLLYPSAIGFDPDDADPEQIRQRNAWITIQKSHAIANGVPVLFSNRLGREQAESADIVIDFWGSSHIIGPFGEVLAKAPVDQPAVITAGIDPEESRRVRDTWPFLQQRRTDFS
ncbi:MAG: acyltransferase [Thiotrichales bacterium]|nr:acyltransferase [Thiotrichales bacterium]